MITHTLKTDAVSWARRLKIRHLEYFLVLKNAGTLSEAARRLHMTQSAMSHWLTELEDLLGARLVVRGRRIRLTGEGEALQRLATRMLGDVVRTHEELLSLAEGAPASLNIGSVTAGIAYLLPGAICRFQEDQPDVSIHVTEAPFSPLLDRLATRDLDIVVGSMDGRAYAPGLAHEVLFEDRIVVIVGAAHPLAQVEKPVWADLVVYPWIMPEKNALMRTRLDTALLENGGAGVRPRIETASVVTIETLLRQTQYVAVCSASLAKHLQELGLVRVLPLSTGFGPVGVVYREDDSRAATQAFIGMLRRQAESIYTA